MLDKKSEEVYNVPDMTDEGSFAKEYLRKYGLFCNGLISEEEWKEFCFDALLMVMSENEDILKRIKY